MRSGGRRWRHGSPSAPGRYSAQPLDAAAPGCRQMRTACRHLQGPGGPRPSSLLDMRIEQLTCSIGAELIGVSLADAARDSDLFTEIKGALLHHKVLFLRDQDIS